MDYSQLKTAIERFGEMLAAYRDNARRPALEREAVQDSLIKRFEYTFEVAWKTCKRHLQEDGFTEAASGSPKSIIRLAAERKLIADAEAWMGYLAFRQDSPWQDYSNDNAETVLDIAEAFYKNVVNLYQQMIGEVRQRVAYGR